MKSQREFMKDIIEKLQQAKIDYALCGSMASSFYGVERSTQDIDILIDPTEGELLEFIGLLGNDYYVSKEAALDALKQNSMFNIIDLESIYKADLMIKKKNPFNDEEFKRKLKGKVLGQECNVITTEDTILSKLLWARESHSEMQRKDVLKILEYQAEVLDMNYLKEWAKTLDVEDDLNDCLSEVGGE
jgi:hypothetical protein